MCTKREFESENRDIACISIVQVVLYYWDVVYEKGIVVSFCNTHKRCSMKKKIAIFANGWGNEYLHEITNGVLSVSEKENTDVFTFVDFSIHSNSIGTNDSEINIFRLPDLKKFDGAILLTNSFNDAKEIEYLQEEVKRTGVPAVSLEYKLDGITSIHTDNYSGMYELAEHMLTKHEAKEILLIGGPKEHQESNDRIRAVVDAYEAHGVEIAKENILHGNWASSSALRCLEEWLEQSDHLPDAVICANDVMALGVCDYFQEKDISVPEDVMVTGFDYLLSGQDNYPSMASVSHEWQKMGQKAFDLLKQQWNGQKDAEEHRLSSKFFPGGSCGCKSKKAEEEIRIGRKKKAQLKKMDGFNTDSHFRHVYNALRKVDDEKGLEEGLNHLFVNDHWMEGNDLMFCLEKEFFHIEDDDRNLINNGYGEEINLVFCLQDGVPQPQKVLKREEAVFYYSDRYEKPGLYIYVPISTENKTLGFAVMSRDMNIVEENYLYIWTRHMNQDMEQVRRNVRIANLTEKLRLSSVTDKLTGVYNRSGCEEKSYPMLEKLHREGKEGVVMIVDIDRMKTINDFYGHVYGDHSLRIVAEALQKESPADWITSRFGGDEFMVAGERRDIDLDDLTERIYRRVRKEKIERYLDFPLSLSIGSIVIDTNTPFNMREAIQRADQAMYIVKNRHHAMLDNE